MGMCLFVDHHRWRECSIVVGCPGSSSDNCVLFLLTDQQGPTVVDLLKKNPAVGLGVVLPRLLQKDEEWYG